ncbi:uncharacterized protein METZ01_LOCUS279682, partial [marine metagenome]
ERCPPEAEVTGSNPVGRIDVKQRCMTLYTLSMVSVVECVVASQ